MASIAAKEVAKEVLEIIGKGQKPNLGKIARKKGYASNTADNPKLITETISYKEVISPVVKAMERERDRAIKLMSKRISKAQYHHLVEATDKLTKNIQLLTGGKTENLGIEGLSDELRKLVHAVQNADS